MKKKLVSPPKPKDARKSVEVVGQLASISIPQFVVAQTGWRLAVLGPDEDLEACPVIAWEVTDTELVPWCRLHAQDGFLSVQAWAARLEQVVGLLAPGEELDAGWCQAAEEVAKALRNDPVASQEHLDDWPPSLYANRFRAFYFGCWREPGSYFWHRASDGTPVRVYDNGESERRLLGGYPHASDHGNGEIPWGYGLDGGLLKGRSLRQGEAVVEQRGGWTAISFWDRSVDSRPDSSSTFVFDALLMPGEALAAARKAFTPIFDRFDFEVVLSQ